MHTAEIGEELGGLGFGNLECRSGIDFAVVAGTEEVIELVELDGQGLNRVRTHNTADKIPG